MPSRNQGSRDLRRQGNRRHQGARRSRARRSEENHRRRCEVSLRHMIEIPRACLLPTRWRRRPVFSPSANDLTQMTSASAATMSAVSCPITSRTTSSRPTRSDDRQQGGGPVDQDGGGKGPRREARSEGRHLRRARRRFRLRLSFCFKTGLNYVSCSPYRVPIARLAQPTGHQGQGQ